MDNMGLVEKVTNDAAQRMPDKFTAAEEVMAFPFRLDLELVQQRICETGAKFFSTIFYLTSNKFP